MQEKYTPKNHIRILTASSLFDGHDAAINIMRRIMQSTGVEVIHMGHNRSVKEIVDCAIQEDVHAIAVTSYQGGHMEFFKYMHDLLQENDAGHIRIFGGGGGTILPSEIKALEEHGICRIYSPEDGRAMGLQGMIDDLVKKSDFPLIESPLQEFKEITTDRRILSRWITAVESFKSAHSETLNTLEQTLQIREVPILGVTGTGGAGKSTLVDELVRRFIMHRPDLKLAILCIDPTKKKSGGALLGDRIRMNAVYHPSVFMRSMATRQAHLSLSRDLRDILKLIKTTDVDLIILETSGIGQSDTEITEFGDINLYVMTPEYGAATQLEKIDMLDYADIVVINKFEKKGAEDALRDVRKQLQRNKGLWEGTLEDIPAFGTMASQFNDVGVHRLFETIATHLKDKIDLLGEEPPIFPSSKAPSKPQIIPNDRSRYLAEIVSQHREYQSFGNTQIELAHQLHGVIETKKSLKAHNVESSADVLETLDGLESSICQKMDKDILEWLKGWDSQKSKYKNDYYDFEVRGKTLSIKTHHNSLSGTPIPKISLPKFRGYGDLVKWKLHENLPGAFPFTAGVYPFKREGEDPTRMFAGEGGPERTNKRFHYVSRGMEAKRLSTAFDSVTLYGEDPDVRPDIYGKIGNSGVNIATLDDAKRLYSGFDLCDPRTSVSMTINGPAATVTAFYLNVAIDQQCEKYLRENGMVEETMEKIKSLYSAEGLPSPSYRASLPDGHDGLGLLLLGISGDQLLPQEVYENIKQDTLRKIRGTVQADILKEDQAQNTCIFSTDFSLRLMGDVQEYFITHQIKNFYSVSISGYHIAEAGANPITQLALTLANGFTYVEYYLSRGMKIDDFAPNLSYFFSNGIDAEYAVIGRVARRIWAKAMKFIYGANKRSQLLKYHIQTSGRSLHAQEIDFNDIRTTLQALNAVYDNCNSLHTNANDEAITTPTESSVRRALAIQLIINKELGMAKNENPLQGSFIIEELTDLVEEAVYVEFEKINERGGVLGAMETMYQRGKIQEESMHYENLKHNGELPIIGVNTFLSDLQVKERESGEIIRANKPEKEKQIQGIADLKKVHARISQNCLKRIKSDGSKGENLFKGLMEAVKYCSLGQITNALYEIGGQYRRNM